MAKEDGSGIVGWIRGVLTDVPGSLRKRAVDWAAGIVLSAMAGLVAWWLSEGSEIYRGFFAGVCATFLFIVAYGTFLVLRDRRRSRSEADPSLARYLDDLESLYGHWKEVIEAERYFLAEATHGTFNCCPTTSAMANLIYGYFVPSVTSTMADLANRFEVVSKAPSARGFDDLKGLTASRITDCHYELLHLIERAGYIRGRNLFDSPAYERLRTLHASAVAATTANSHRPGIRDAAQKLSRLPAPTAPEAIKLDRVDSCPNVSPQTRSAGPPSPTA